MALNEQMSFKTVAATEALEELKEVIDNAGIDNMVKALRDDRELGAELADLAVAYSEVTNLTGKY